MMPGALFTRINNIRCHSHSSKIDFVVKSGMCEELTACNPHHWHR